MDNKICLVILIFMLLTATFGAAAAKNSNVTSRNNRTEFCCENTSHNPLMDMEVSSIKHSAVNNTSL